VTRIPSCLGEPNTEIHPNEDALAFQIEIVNGEIWNHLEAVQGRQALSNLRRVGVYACVFSAAGDSFTAPLVRSRPPGRLVGGGKHTILWEISGSPGLGPEKGPNWVGGERVCHFVSFR